MAKKEDIGYVYIFTNESFREGWIKIGKTKNIKKRLNDLDNTSCPLPFDVYATLKTNRYEEAELFVHEYISHFKRDLRIRPNREYFKVTKEEALEILCQVKRMMNEPSSEIVVHYDKDSKFVKQLKKKYGNREEETGNDVPQQPLHDDSTPRYSSQTNLPAYVRYLSSSTMREMLEKAGVRTDITNANDINELNAIRKLIKQQEKEHKPRIHNTYSCAISKYVEFLEHGFTFQDMQHDAMLVDVKKQTEAPKVKSKAKPKAPKEKKPRKKPDPPFKFSMIGMPVDTIITFAPTGVQVRVASNDTIEYQGRTYSLSGFCATFMPEERRIPAGQYQGPAYFTYNGKTLKKLRKERETK